MRCGVLLASGVTLSLALGCGGRSVAPMEAPAGGGGSAGGIGGVAGNAPAAGRASGGAAASGAGFGGALAGAGGSATGGVGVGGQASVGSLVDFLGDPTYPDTFWRTATAQESRLDLELLEQGVLAEAANRELHSLVVARDGKLVFERYGWNSAQNPDDPLREPHQVLPTERHPIYSSTKSILAALVGIALNDGVFALDTTAASWFADYESLNPSPEKSSITLEDLLTMRSGLAFTEGEQGTFSAADPARAMLSREVVDLPVGQVWNYSSGGSDIIAEMLRLATGEAPLDYANAKLFAPMGIVEPPWAAGASGTNHGGWGLALTSREMARFGELLRNSGAWDGQQLLPAAWIDAATSAHCQSSWGRAYGYHFWVSNVPGFFNTLGAFGQEIFVSREHGLVVVLTANVPSEEAFDLGERIVRDAVLPALR